MTKQELANIRKWYGKNKIVLNKEFGFSKFYDAVVEIDINTLNKTEKEIQKEINRTKVFIKNRNVKLKVNFIKDE